MDTKQQRTASGSASRKSAGGAVSTGRRRLPPHEREHMILDAATRFFAQEGFDANIRDLADQVGVSQGLIFKYFESKEKLVRRVYERTFLQRWRPEWERMLTDRSKPLETRLSNFYRSYLETVDDYVWIRIALISGLSGNDLTSTYIRENVTQLMRIIALEVRREGRDTLKAPVDLMEMEQVWMLHSTFIYYLIRKHIFRTPTVSDQGKYVDSIVQTFLHGRLNTN